MNPFERFFKIFRIQELGKQRIEQLHQEEKIDKLLINHYKECPDVVFHYLIKYRALNRKCSIELYNASVLDYLEKAEENMHLLDKLHGKYNLENL